MPAAIVAKALACLAINTMTAKVMAKTRVICSSGEFPVASCAIITKNINAIIAKEVTKDGFFIDCSFIFLVSCAFSGQPSPFFFFLDYIRRRFYLLFYALFYSPFILQKYCFPSKKRREKSIFIVVLSAPVPMPVPGSTPLLCYHISRKVEPHISMESAAGSFHAQPWFSHKNLLTITHR